MPISSVLITYGDSFASPTDIERISPVSQEEDEDFLLFLHKVDQLLEGTTEDQSEVYTMMKSKEYKVGKYTHLFLFVISFIYSQLIF